MFSINNSMPSFTNLNACYSFANSFSTTLQQLSGTPINPTVNCSEVIVQNLGASPLYVWDNNNFNSVLSANYAYVVAPSAEATFRGLTDSSQLSARFLTGSGWVTFRTQYFSSNPLNIY
jgi:hypothetical protein